MADKATTSEHPEGAGTGKKNNQAQEAIAESLAELKRDAPERTARRKTASKASTDDLFKAIPSRETSEDQHKTPKAKAKTSTKKTSNEKADSADIFSGNDTQADERPSKSSVAPPMTALLFQEPDVARAQTRRRSSSQESEPSEATNKSEASTEDSREENKGKRRGSRGRKKSQPEPTTPPNTLRTLPLPKSKTRSLPSRARNKRVRHLRTKTRVIRTRTRIRTSPRGAGAGGAHPNLRMKSRRPRVQHG